MKKTLAVLLILAMLSLPFAGCSNGGEGNQTSTDAPADATDTASAEAQEASGQTAGEPVTISMWIFQTFSPHVDQMLIERIQQFAAENNVNIVLETVQETTFTTKFNAALEAGRLPDICCVRDDTLMNIYPNIPFLDLTETIDQIEIDTGHTFQPTIKEHGKIDGKLYRMPTYYSAQPAIYRKDLLKAAGYDELPGTWEELIQCMRDVSDPDNGIYGFGVGCGPTDNDGETLLRTWLWSEGGRLFNENGEPDPVNPDTIRVIQTYVDLYKEGCIAPSATTWDAGGNNKTYLVGESALVYNPFTLYNAMLEPGYEELLANTGYDVLPEGKNGTIMFLSLPGYAINESCKNPEVAKALLTYLSDAEWYSKWIGDCAPIMGPVFEDTAAMDIWQSTETNAAMAAIGTNKMAFHGYPSTDIEAQRAGSLVYNSYLLNTAITRIITENLTVEEGLELLKKDMENLINK